jgi:acyl transferase domain-containing protein
MLCSALCHTSAGAIGVPLTDKKLIEGSVVVPFSRWDVDVHSNADRMSTRFVGHMADIDQWDMQAFGISQNEAVQTDPQQRMLLTCMVATLRHSGLSIESLKGSNRGVAVGIATAEYSRLLADTNAPLTPYMALQGTVSVACGRLSYTFGCNGP